jgi:glycosyltransferase involved in cell wall biosynthesis
MISIIIPTYNRMTYLFRAIESVLYQTYIDWELIIIDDGSTDKTKEHVLELIKINNKVRYVKTPNRGVSAARNLGINISKGKFIAFLDSDDEWLPNKMQIQMDFLQSNPNLLLVHGEEIWIRNGKRVNQKNIHKKGGGDIFSQCLDLCAISPSTVLIKKELFKEVGFFREDFPVCEDYDLWLRIAAKCEVGFTPDPLIVKYGGHLDQLSTKFVGMDYWRIKSMVSLINSSEISLSKKELVRKKMEYKAKILKGGALKHGNVDLLNKLELMC